MRPVEDLGVEQVATSDDWSQEYLDLVLAVRVVKDLDEALEHIRTIRLPPHRGHCDGQSRHGRTVLAGSG